MSLEELPVVVYLLIQGDKVVDHCLALNCLRVGDIDSYTGFKIAVGIQTEWGEKEIIGVLADVAPLFGYNTWHITPSLGGGSYDMTTNDAPSNAVKHRLRLAMERGAFDDLANLPPPLTIEPSAIQIG
jgi:hypothetical protein